MPKYNEIFKLEKLCKENNIECEMLDLYDGYKLSIIKDNKEITDAIEHQWSLGSKEDLLETWEYDNDDVIGYLNAEETLDYIKKFL